MTPKPLIELLPNITEHKVPGIRILGTLDTAGNGIEDDLMGKVSPNPSNQLTIIRPGSVNITLHGLSGNSGNSTRCVLHGSLLSEYVVYHMVPLSAATTSFENVFPSIVPIFSKSPVSHFPAA